MTTPTRTVISLLATAWVGGTLALAVADRTSLAGGPDVTCQILANGIVHPLESARKDCPLARYDRVARVEIGGTWTYVAGHDSLRRAARAADQWVRVEVVREGRTLVMQIPVRPESRTALVGNLFAAGSLALVMLTVALAVLWSSKAAAVFPFVVLYTSVGVLLTVALCGVSERLGLVAACAWAMTAASLAHLAMAFPQPRRLLCVAPHAAVLPYVVAVLLGVAAMIAVIRFPELWILTDRILLVSSAGAWGLVVLGSGSAIRRSRSTLARARARVMLIGTLLVPLAPLSGVILLGSGDHPARVPLSILAAAGSLVPIGYSIVRYELFDVARHVRYALAVILLAAATASVFTLLALAVRDGFFADGPTGDPGLLFTLLFSSVIAAEIVRVRMQAAVQRWVRPGARRLALLAQGHAEQAAISIDAHRCLQEAILVLREGLDCEQIVAFLRHSGGWSIVAGSEADRLADSRLADAAVRALGAADLLHVARVEDPGESPCAFLVRSGVEVAVALRSAGEIDAILLASASQRRLPYDTTELSFVRAVGAQAALTLTTVRLMEDLVASERFSAVGRVSANLAHEIGKPLGVIERLAELLPTHLEDGKRLARAARMIMATASELREIVRAVLEEPTMTAADRGECPAVPIVAIVEHAVSAVSRIHGAERVALVASSTARVAVSDRRRVERALVNLLDNALRAEPAGGAVVASVAESDDCVRITIEDHGAGMDPDTLERAFEPFFTTRSPGEGTGLGLAFAREVILGAGGAIDMESAPGAGTRAEVRLPLRVLAESRAA